MDKLQPGQTLGAYRIISQIGQGGMATVYKAYQPSMDRNVAIKVLPGQLAESGEFVKRFQQEARTIARLEHPHILPVFEYGEDNGVTYFVMRYLDAGTLKDRMEAGPLSLDEIDHLFTQLAEALGYAHDRGVVHRDLKPSNALVDAEGNVFLTDFGIAKILENASPRLTRTDAIMGTPAYISPEQAKSLPVDQRSDIYSLGIILYEMVTGRVPFSADTPMAVILKHLNDPLPLPTEVKSGIPPGIEQVILKALAKEPQDRFASTDEFVAAWKRALKEMQTMRLGTDSTFTPALTSSLPSAPTQVEFAPATRTMTKSGNATKGVLIGCVAVVCLMLSVVGVFVLGSRLLAPPPPPTSVPAPTNVPQPTATVPVPVSNVLLEDDFSQTNAVWGTETNSDSSIEYEGATLRVVIYTPNWFVWTRPDDEEYRNILMEVTAINNDTDQYTAFGLMCHQQSDNQSYYYFAITPAGQYVIARTVPGQTDLFLTNNDAWEFSDLIARNAASYRLGAECGNGRLTLYVDGRPVDSVTDSTYTSGKVGLIVWSAEEPIRTDLSFDDFLLTSLP